jgi:hypothetical protein
MSANGHHLETRTQPYALLLSANSTNNSAIAAQVPTITRPTTGVINMGTTNTQERANLIELLCFGTDGDNETGQYVVIGWETAGKTTAAQGSNLVYVPHHIVTITATLSSSIPGISGWTPNGASDYFADTIAYTSGDSTAKLVLGVSDKSAASVLIDPTGSQIVQVLPFRNSSAASLNALFRQIN